MNCQEIGPQHENQKSDRASITPATKKKSLITETVQSNNIADKKLTARVSCKELKQRGYLRLSCRPAKAG